MRPNPQRTPSPERRTGSSTLRPAAAGALPLLTLILAMLWAAACQAAGPAGWTAPPPSTAASGSPPAAGSPSASPSAEAAFPVTLTDDEGTAVTIPAQPQRIVSLSPANTETVFALGGGSRLVGGTDADDHPAEAKALPDVATFQGVVMERLLDLDPDLVLAAGNNFTPPADVLRIRDRGIPVVVLYAETVDEILADIRLIGRAIGAGAEAEAMASDLDRRIAQISALATADGRRPRVFYELGDEPDLYGPADGSFVADMISLAGGEPITTGDRVSFTMPLERLVAADPEVIVLGDAAYGVSRESVLARGAPWTRMTAVRSGAVRPVDDIIVTRPGPRLADGLAALALAIRPDLVIPGASPGPSASAPTSAPVSAPASYAP
ncbi:MAG TPA: helical backbone metal receptor [Candidatus Limnocylindrales bacterium]|nr:helical backbone metal receptor [Candidatus Limnocylindrales bacterium]